jgi:hypothetical protein
MKNELRELLVNKIKKDLKCSLHYALKEVNFKDYFYTYEESYSKKELQQLVINELDKNIDNFRKLKTYRDVIEKFECEDKVYIRIELKEELIQDVIITAIEGGSNYWYYIPNTPEGMNKYKNMSYAEKMTKYIFEGGGIDIHDIENEKDKLGTLNIESIKKGMQTAFNSHIECISNIISENYDAGDADVLFQLFVMNEVVFG